MATSAYDVLRQKIIMLVLPPGAKLQTRDLCTQFGTGLSPVREALSRLVSEGLVQQQDHRGFAVTPLSVPDLESLTKARCWLNEKGLRESILHGDDEWEESVLLAFHRLARVGRESIEGDGVRNPAWEKAHRMFHRALISGCRSDWLIGFCEQLFDAAERYRNVARAAGVVRAVNEDEHRAIMQTAVDRDGDKAAQLLTQHFMRTAELAKTVLLQGDISEAARKRSDKRRMSARV